MVNTTLSQPGIVIQLFVEPSVDNVCSTFLFKLSDRLGRINSVLGHKNIDRSRNVFTMGVQVRRSISSWCLCPRGELVKPSNQFFNIQIYIRSSVRF